MKNFSFLCITILVFAYSLQTFGQNQNYVIEMDSTFVVNNAGAVRIVNGLSQYVMMPTQYNSNASEGQPYLVTFEPLSGYRTVKELSTSLKGLFVNDIVIGSNNEIYFFGQQNDTAITGQIDAAGNSVNWVYKDASAVKNIAGCVVNYNNSSRIFETMQRAGGASELALWMGTSVASRRNYDALSLKDMASSFNGNFSNSFVAAIGRISDTVMGIMSCKMSGIQNNPYREKFVLPNHWKWHEGGGSITNISTDRYVAAIDVRCDTSEEDAVLLIKFTANSTISIHDCKMIVFPAPKVIVHDISFINEPFEGDVSLNILGQFIDTSDPFSYAGNPFCIKIDTSFNSYDILSYAVFFQDYHLRNFQLKKGCYDSNNLQFITSGGYNAYSTTYPKGGIYIVANSIGYSWLEYPICESSINAHDQTASLTALSVISCLFFNSNNISFPASLSTLTFDTTEQITCDGKSFSPKSEKFLTNCSREVYYCDGQLTVLNAEEVSRYIIYDAIGKEVLKGTAQRTINVSSLRPGVYIVRLLKDNAIITSAKFVK